MVLVGARWSTTTAGGRRPRRPPRFGGLRRFAGRGAHPARLRRRPVRRCCPHAAGHLRRDRARCSGGGDRHRQPQPRRDNGLKVVGADGAQVGPPHDAAIEAWTERPDPTPRPPGHVRPLPVAGDLAEQFVARALRLAGPMEHPPHVVYTAMHGVGATLLEDVLGSAGLRSVRAVESQRRPDPDFPSVERPNPEEPAALERLLAAARRGDDELALALDPDADRLAVAVPVPGAAATAPWRVLTGDEVGALLASFLLGRGTGGDRLVCSTIVSSQLVGRICAAAGDPPRGDPDRFQVARAAGTRPTRPDPGALLRGGDRLRRRPGRPRQGRRHRRRRGVRPGLGAQRARSQRARRARRPRSHPRCVRDPQRRRPPHGRPRRRSTSSNDAGTAPARRPDGPRTDRRPVSSGGGWTTAPGSSVDARGPSRG